MPSVSSSEISCFGFTVLISILAVGVAYLVLRRSDPGHAFRRAVGSGLCLLGTIALVGALLAFSMVLLGGYTLSMSAVYTPHEGSSNSQSGVTIGPTGLSVWLFLAGGVLVWGILLSTRRFSLRSMLIGIGLLALLASLPHVLVKAGDHVATITISAERLLHESEWEKLQQDLLPKNLRDHLPKDVRSRLDLPLEQAIKQMEVKPLFSSELEANGRIGALVTIHFSSELSVNQTNLLFDALCQQFEAAVPRAIQGR